MFAVPSACASELKRQDSKRDRSTLLRVAAPHATPDESGVHGIPRHVATRYPTLGYCQRTDYSTNHLSTGYDARLSSKRPSVTDMPRMPAPPPGFDATVSRASEIENVEMA